MKIIVTGGRSFPDRDYVFCILDQLHVKRPIAQLVEGGATGADAWARAWVKSRISPNLLTTCEANWERYRNNAGRVRNCFMLREHRPDVVVAFEGKSGTRHMVRIAEEARIPVIKTWETNCLQEFLL